MARKQIVARMEAQGLLEKIEPHTHMVPHGDRSGVVIEPYLTDQWYVDAKTLAQPAIAAVREGRTSVRAEELGDDLLQLDGEHPALVHLAPALVGPPDSRLVRTGTGRASRLRIAKMKIFVAETEAQALSDAQTYYGKDE